MIEIRRRRAIRGTGAVIAGGALAGCGGSPPAGDESGGGDGETATSTPSGGGTETVSVGPGGEFVFEPGTDDPLTIGVGTTVRFVWESDNHNIVVESQPAEASWSGVDEIKTTGFEHEHTFEVPGTYGYFCEPHKAAGMKGTVEVTEN